MKNITNKTKSFLDAVFYVVVVWHIAVSHQPEPEHHQYAVIELFEHGQYAETKDYLCKDYVLWVKDSFLGMHEEAHGAYNLITGKYVEGNNIKCRYILNRPTNMEQNTVSP